jgi:hypothetical protein
VEERGRRPGTGGRNDPNNVCTYEYMNKEKNYKVHLCHATNRF